MGSGPALLSIHPRACLGPFTLTFKFSLTGDKKNSLAEGGGTTRNDGRGVAQACLSHPYV